MVTFLLTFHIIVSILLIVIVLLQAGKGADMGAIFGGGSSNTLFGSSGPSSFLGKITAFAAIIFMITSLSLAYINAKKQVSSVVDKPSATKSAPAQTEPKSQVPATPEQKSQPDNSKK